MGFLKDLADKILGTNRSLSAAAKSQQTTPILQNPTVQKALQNPGQAIKDAGKFVVTTLAKQGAPIPSLLVKADPAAYNLSKEEANNIPVAPGVFYKDKKVTFDSNQFTMNIGSMVSAPVQVGAKAAKGLLTKAAKSKIEVPPVVPPVFKAEQYVEEMANAQKAAQKSSEQLPILLKAKKTLEDVKAKIVDRTAPIEDALAQAAKKNQFEVLPKHDIHLQIDSTLRAPALAGQFAKDHGLFDVIKNVDNIDNLDQYLIAKRSLEVGNRGIETGRDLAKDEQLVAAFKDKYEPIAQKVNDYSGKVLDYSVESGLISKEIADKLRQENPHYVPLQRIFNELETQASGGTKAVASLSKQGVVQKLVGSEREIQSPTTSLLEKTHDAFMQGERNKAGRMLAAYKDLPGFSTLIRELKPGETAKHTFSYLDNGVKRVFETTPEIASAARSLDDQQLALLGKIVSTPTRVLKAGATGLNPAFVAANFAKDQLFGLLTSSHPFQTSIANPKVFLKSLFNALKHGELYDEMVRAGAGGTSFDIARGAAKETVEGIRSKGSLVTRAKYIARNPSELLRIVEDGIGRSEEITRLQQFEGTRQALLKEGRTMEDATLLAAHASRENTANFARRGEYGRVLNATIPYLNAGIQGSRTMFRAAAKNPDRFSAMLAITVFMPIAITTAWNLNDPKRAEAYQDITDSEKQNNFIIVPPNPTQDAYGRWNVIKIPIPKDVASLGVLVRKGIESARGINHVGGADILNALAGPVVPLNVNFDSPDSFGKSLVGSLVPQALKPSAEVASNYNFFTQQPIVPKSQEGYIPEYQERKDTTGTAKVLGKLLHASPIKIQHFIQSSTAELGSLGLGATDRLLAAAGVIPKSDVKGQTVQGSLTRRFTKAYGGKTEGDAYDLAAEAVQQKKTDDFIRRKQAEAEYKQIFSSSREEAVTRFEKLLNTDPEMAQKVMDVFEQEQKNLTGEEKQLLQLGVTDGTRAQYIVNKLKTLSSTEERVNYVQNLTDKGLFTDAIIDQVSELLASN